MVSFLLLQNLGTGQNFQEDCGVSYAELSLNELCINFFQNDSQFSVYRRKYHLQAKVFIISDCQVLTKGLDNILCRLTGQLHVPSRIYGRSKENVICQNGSWQAWIYTFLVIFSLIYIWDIFFFRLFHYHVYFPCYYLPLRWNCHGHVRNVSLLICKYLFCFGFDP